MRETFAVLKKEIVSELRGKHGLYMAFLFSIVAAFALGMASSLEPPPASTAGVLLMILLLFSSISSLARTFVLEEEQGTGELLRMLGNPFAIFFGKMFYNLCLLVVITSVAVPALILFARFSVSDPVLLVVSLLFACAGLAAAVSFCGALASRSRSRATLSGVISTPVLLPWVWMGLNAFRGALGDVVQQPWASTVGLLGMALVFGSMGPLLYSAVWKR